MAEANQGLEELAYKDTTRCGVIAIAGAPNAGKSTLLNAIVGSKVSIVTRKAQTTRARISGVIVSEKTQFIFVDTPGIFIPQKRLERAMVDAAWSGVYNADVVLLLVDAHRSLRGVDNDNTHIISNLVKNGCKIILALNKIDLVEKSKLLALTECLNAQAFFSAIFMISGMKGDGLADLVAFISSQLPAGPWLYPQDQIADMPLRLLAAEISREKLFKKLHQELPYNLTVETETWEERKDNSIKITQIIYVTRNSHKKIVLGKNGKLIKMIGSSAREELEQILGQRVHLFLFIKVRKSWLEEPLRYQEMGLEFPR